jgi:CheY-like chemotaxis protein
LRAQLQVMEHSPGAAMGGHADITEMARLLEVREQERRELADRLDMQRAETIDLGAQLRLAQDQIKQLGASLAEARLLAKMGGRNAPPPAIREVITHEPITREPNLPPPLPALAPESFALAESNDLIRSMRRCHQAFLKNPEDVSHLNELHCHAHSFAERARAGGLVALHRLSAAFSGLAQELYHYPEQVNDSALRTIGQTIEFLTTLLKVKDLRHVKDPATATVYAVDDDADNCDCIGMAMETAMMRTSSSQDPAKAICELAEKPCDLIFLDVNLPGMDGFELCAEIRQLTLHTTTPIIFLSGLTSSENRMQSSLSGGNEFVGKPFILCELTVKALTLILKSQLHLA